jgi:hypothetical protein
MILGWFQKGSITAYIVYSVVFRNNLKIKSSQRLSTLGFTGIKSRFQQEPPKLESGGGVNRSSRDHFFRIPHAKIG